MRASLILLLAAACATSGSSASSVTLTSNLNYGAVPITYAVTPNHVRSNNGDALDAYFDKDCL
jgi:diketogulonate reductase-like aldo/keto reductase